MKVINTEIPEVKIIEPQIFRDGRGYFYESFNQEKFSELVCPGIKFVQDNESCSCRDTVRGMHWQMPPFAQSKLVRCTRGSLIDVALDIRNGSPTYMQYVKCLLNTENKRQFWIPRGFAHGFIALEDDTILQYKCDNLYNKDSEASISYKTVDFFVDNSEIREYNLSEKDKNAPLLEEAQLNNTMFNYTDNLYE